MTVVAICLLTLAVLVGGNQPANRVSIFAPAPEIEQAKILKVDNQAVVNVGEFPQGGKPGEPMLPYKQVCLLVPPDADLGTVSAGLASESWEELPGEHEIAAVKPAVTWDGEKFIISWGDKDESLIVNGKDSSIYGGDSYFPNRPIEVVSVSKFRQWKLVELRVWLALYNPVQKKVLVLKSAQPVLSVEKLSAAKAVGLDSAVLPAMPNTDKFELELRSKIANPKDIEAFYGEQTVPAAQGGGPAPGAPGTNPADYVIITTSTIVANSTQLANFIAAKTTAGFTVKTVVEGAAQGDYTYLSGSTCDQRADNIRQWLVTYYLGDGIQYVLLIGNPHPTTFNSNISVPMKMCWPRQGQSSDQQAPSDMYFAELSGNWNLDGDSYYGEFNGDYGAGGADKNCELKVGRIPFYGNYTDLDNILGNCITYDTATTNLGYRSKVLIPAAVSNFAPQDNNGDGDASDAGDYGPTSWRTFGADWGEAVKTLASSISFTPYTLYEQIGVYADGSAYPLTACNAALNNANLISEWGNRYGFVTWWAHGSQSSSSRFTWISDVSYVGICGNLAPHLETTWPTLVQSSDFTGWLWLSYYSPAFVVAVSCNNGYPENNSNLAYAMLKSPAAIGTISATRVSWYAIGSWSTGLGATYGDNASFGYYGFDRMANSGEDIGTALVNCRSSFGTGWAGGESWMNIIEFNIYGDPSLSLGLAPSTTKWEQLPDETTTGIDIRCDNADGIQRTLADDFLCTRTGPITDVVIWGSWLSDIKGQIQRIHLSIHSDDPVGPGGSDPDNEYSKPDQLLWQQDFTASDFVETLYKYDEPEWFWDPTNYDPPPTPYEHYGIWQYDISIDSNQFIQQGDPCNPVIYWLDVWVDLVPGPNNPMFGWKTSLEHWNDDAVFMDTAGMWQELRYPPEHEYAPNSIDLSFRIITGEEEPNNIKWIQEPDLTPTGIDIRLDRNDGIPRIMADDFLCTTTGLVTDVHLWGSWKYDEKGEIRKIHLSIHSDDPVGPGGSDPDNNYSMPDVLLWEKDFTRADFNETLFYTLPNQEYEWWWDIENGDILSNGDTQVWKYDIYIDPADAFRQEGDPCDPIVYWLDVYVETDDINYPGSEFGWKTSLKHWNDDAVYADVPLPPFNWQELRYPFGHEYETESIDMAFAITTEVNEPNEPGKPLQPHTKWSQPPIEVDSSASDPTYCGWDEESHNKVDFGTPLMKIVADDYHCIGSMPVTSIHWWGSYLDWEQGSGLPPVLPDKWWIGFWSNVPANVPPYNLSYSYPEILLHSITIPADRVAIEKVGSDEYYDYYPSDICYQYNVDLELEEVFWQDEFKEMTTGDIYWISIVAEYNDVAEPYNKWGWKSRPWHWMDDAVTFTLDFEPAAGFNLDPCMVPVIPIKEPVFGDSMDMAFELDTDPNYIKWEQLYTGIRHWPHYEDVNSMFLIDDPGKELLVADDWRCLRRTLVTAIVWWGSYIGYNYEACSQGPFMPLPVSPNRFRLTIWTDVPAGADSNYVYSHPGEPIWEYVTNQYDEVLIGYDKHPERTPPTRTEPVFRYSVRLPEEDWFKQKDVNSIFWLSVQAIYDINQPNYPWGWTNHEHVFNDDAVQGYADVNGWHWRELYDQTDASEDMSFILFTDPNECNNCADYNVDLIVNFDDYADFADAWLWTGIPGGNNSDLNCDGNVDWYDVKIFADQWLSSCP
jgi:hypothetical protein